MSSLEQVVNHRLAIEYQRREFLTEKLSRLNQASGKALHELAEVEVRICGLRARLSKTEKAVA
jgi:hypothetical protein